MFIKSIKLKKIYIIIICFLLIAIILSITFISYFFCFNRHSSEVSSNIIENTNFTNSIITWGADNTQDNINNSVNSNEQHKEYVKWFEFNTPYSVLDKTSKLDINSHIKNEDVKLNWVELISYLACKYGNEFKKFKQKDLDNVVNRLKSGEKMSDIVKDLKNYSYYYECYSSVLEEFIGDYEVENQSSTSSSNGSNNNQNTNNRNSKNNLNNTSSNVSNSNQITEKSYKSTYGIKAFHPIAKGYSYNHYDDFGNSRSYGYKRVHFGNDLMGSIGTPIIATESGIIEELGWNQYGGWRVGIRSFNKKRYYYYAHLRKDHPYSKNLEKGMTIKAGDVIGYLGMTGYSTKENVNNINVPHLHYGMQLIFDEVQYEGPNQIWVDMYPIVDFLQKNRSAVYMNDQKSKDYIRKYDIIDPIIPD